MRIIYLIALLIVSSTLTGCTGDPQWGKPLAQPSIASVDVPPKDVLQQTKALLTASGLSVDQDNDGVILTGWQQHKGTFHIGRHWQERTRFRIAIIPDWNEPTSKARLEITSETEERAAEGQRWDPNPNLNREARTKELLDRIVSELKKPAVK